LINNNKNIQLSKLAWEFNTPLLTLLSWKIWPLMIGLRIKGTKERALLVTIY